MYGVKFYFNTKLKTFNSFLYHQCTDGSIIEPYDLQHLMTMTHFAISTIAEHIETNLQKYYDQETVVSGTRNTDTDTACAKVSEMIQLWSKLSGKYVDGSCDLGW